MRGSPLSWPQDVAIGLRTTPRFGPILTAQAEANRGFDILQSLIHGLVKEKFLPAGLAGGMTILTWSIRSGPLGLLVEGQLAQMAGNDLKSHDEIEPALRTFEFLISGGPKKRL